MRTADKMMSWPRAVMLAFLLLAFGFFLVDLFITVAHAGESVYLGTIEVTDAGSVNNRTTATPFNIGGAGTKIAIQCPDAGAWVLTSQGFVGIRAGVLMPPTQQVATSIDWNAKDAGTYTNGMVAVRPVEGSCCTACIVTSSSGW